MLALFWHKHICLDIISLCCARLKLDVFSWFDWLGWSIIAEFYWPIMAMNCFAQFKVDTNLLHIILHVYLHLLHFLCLQRISSSTCRPCSLCFGQKITSDWWIPQTHTYLQMLPVIFRSPALGDMGVFMLYCIPEQAVRLEGVSAQCTRYMVVVNTNGRQDTEESVVLGMDFNPSDRWVRLRNDVHFCLNESDL